MKPIIALVLVMLSFQACTYKTNPVKTPPRPAAPSAPAAFIVVDGMGNILTPKDRFPLAIGQQVNYTQITRAFTPNQRKNLLYRFNSIPPKIIYVAPAYTLHSLKGTYCIYKKKFWYWQHSNGLFYLDETYYR
ncbi:hypothetical protein [Hydrotalea sp.]|uniref:hypothetical protein n=1 Tax=Hydrotalea sp. TaxID=2881279 RepID=UPI00258300FE|nr:hypothetical protein [Hydrotalea sp.]